MNLAALVRDLGRSLLTARAYRISACAFVFLVANGCSPSSNEEVVTNPGQDPTAEWVVDSYTKLLRDYEPSVSVTQTGDLQLRIQLGDQDHTAFLDNALQGCLASPEDKQDIIEQHVQSAIESLRPADDSDPSRVVPVIKDAAYLAEVNASLEDRGRTQGIEAHSEVLNDELVVLYALDTETSIKFLSTEDLEALLPPESRRDRAVENLLAILPDLERHGADGTYMLTAGGNYESSLILADSIWTKENFKVEGDFVVAVPARDMLLITGSENEAGLTTVREQARSIASEGTYSLIPCLFVRRSNKWQIFDPNR